MNKSQLDHYKVCKGYYMVFVSSGDVNIFKRPAYAIFKRASGWALTKKQYIDGQFIYVEVETFKTKKLAIEYIKFTHAIGEYERPRFTSTKDNLSDYQNDPCEKCGMHAVWCWMYSSYCDHCGNKEHDHVSELLDYQDVEAEREFIRRDNGFYDDMP